MLPFFPVFQCIYQLPFFSNEVNSVVPTSTYLFAVAVRRELALFWPPYSAEALRDSATLPMPSFLSTVAPLSSNPHLLELVSLSPFFFHQPLKRLLSTSAFLFADFIPGRVRLHGCSSKWSPPSFRFFLWCPPADLPLLRVLSIRSVFWPTHPHAQLRLADDSCDFLHPALDRLLLIPKPDTLIFPGLCCTGPVPVTFFLRLLYPLQFEAGECLRFARSVPSWTSFVWRRFLCAGLDFFV